MYMKRTFCILIFIASFFLFFPYPVHAEDCAPSQGQPGVFTISGSCSFANEVDGVDAGTGDQNSSSLVITNNAKLTVGNVQTLAVGTIEIESGGEIALPEGAIIKLNKPLWIAPSIDADGDGFPSGACGTLEIATTQPSGKVRKNVYTPPAGGCDVIDCNDDPAHTNANKVWKALAADPYEDKDGDTYGSILANKKCAGGTSILADLTNIANVSAISSVDGDDVVDYGITGKLKSSVSGSDCDDTNPAMNVSCCLAKGATCSLASQCCGGSCCNGTCGSSCCWSVDGTNCDEGCATASINAVTVYTGCTQGTTCSGTNCWKFGGVCDATCTGSGYSTSTIDTTCVTVSGSCSFVSSCKAKASNPRYKTGGTPVTAYQLSGTCAQGSGNCYKGSGTHYTIDYDKAAMCGGRPWCWNGSGQTDCIQTPINKWSGVGTCSWTAATYPYTVSSAVTKYTGSGACSGSGSGTCYRLSGGTTYYTGNGAVCPTGGSCPTGNYFNQTQCTFIPQ